MLEVYIVLLHKVQLHVSALDNGHLQVVHEILIKQLYKTYMSTSPPTRPMYIAHLIFVQLLNKYLM